MTADEYLVKRIEELEKIVDQLTAALNGEKRNRSVYFHFEFPSPSLEYKVYCKDGVMTVEEINNDK